MRLELQNATQLEYVKFFIWDGQALNEAIAFSKRMWLKNRLDRAEWIDFSEDELEELKVYDASFN